MSEQKGLKGMARLGVILALYSAAACVGLAFVYTGTEKIIEQRQLADQEAALRELFPEADEFRPLADVKSADASVLIGTDDPENTGVYMALKGGGTVGMALSTSRFSYGGAIKCLVGVGTNGKISGVKILEHSDTPGLGANAASSNYYVDRAQGIHFYDQFAGKDVSHAFEPKQDVIAITAATITSQAVATSVKAAGEAASAWFAKGGAK